MFIAWILSHTNALQVVCRVVPLTYSHFPCPRELAARTHSNILIDVGEKLDWWPVIAGEWNMCTPVHSGEESSFEFWNWCHVAVVIVSYASVLVWGITACG